MLQEQDVLQDILVLDKDIMKKYTDSIIESSCTKERGLLEKNFDATARDQFCVFQSMVERGYYPVKNADAEAVKQAKQQMCEIADSMPKADWTAAEASPAAKKRASATSVPSRKPKKSN